MAKITINNTKRIAILILNEIAALALVIAVILSVTYGTTSGTWDDLLSNKTYEESNYFETQAQNQVTRAIRAASRSSRFETLGKYDPNRIVDIQEYAENQIIRGNVDSQGLCYTLGELLKWAQTGWTYSTAQVDVQGQLSFDQANISFSHENENSEEIQDSIADMPEDNLNVVDEEQNRQEFMASLNEYFAQHENDWKNYYDYYQDVSIDQAGYYIYSQDILNEIFAPTNYDSIVEYAVEKNMSLDVVYEYMNTTLNNIVSDVLSYRENVSLFAENQVNVRYFLVDLDNENVFTNVVDYSARSVGDIKLYVESLGAYVLYENETLSIDSKNLNLSVTDLYGYAETYGMSCSDNYMLAVGIDTNYPAHDALWSGYATYSSMQPRIWAIMIFAILSILCYVATLIYLTLTAGYKEGDDSRTIHLNMFDRWKSELAAAVLIIPAFAGLFLIGQADEIFIFLTTAVVVAFIGLAENALFLIGWNSLVKRIKAGVLWKNSILHAIFNSLGQILNHTNKTTKVQMLFVLYLTLSIIFQRMGRFGIAVLVIINLIALIYITRQSIQEQEIITGLDEFEKGRLDYQFDTERFTGSKKELADEINVMRKTLQDSVNENMKSEKLKADLITNVSHDIKTPLTSIINYVDLLKRENIQNEKANDYIEILDQKSQRLKHLTEDLVEASKISSGNIMLEYTDVNMQEMISQTAGEFVEKFAEKDLQLITSVPDDVIMIRADGRRLWRVMENLYNNVAKYAMPGTRVYVDLVDLGGAARFSIKNISEQALNIEAEDLTERFIRGDVSRNTEGSGLGLSIARNLTELQGGEFEVYLDGDLFRVSIMFPKSNLIEESLEKTEMLSDEYVQAEEERLLEEKEND